MKTIPNFSRYSIDEKGNIYSENYKNTGQKKILKPARTKDGYLSTMILNDSGKYCSYKIHRWVALTYLGERPKGFEINHIDGNKINNAVENLEYISKSENLKHAYRLKLITPKSGELNGKSKLTSIQVKEIREYVANFKGRYYGRNNLAKKYGVSSATIKEIVNHRRNNWANV